MDNFMMFLLIILSVIFLISSIILSYRLNKSQGKISELTKSNEIQEIISEFKINRMNDISKQLVSLTQEKERAIVFFKEIISKILLIINEKQDPELFQKVKEELLEYCDLIQFKESIPDSLPEDFNG